MDAVPEGGPCTAADARGRALCARGRGGGGIPRKPALVLLPQFARYRGRCAMVDPLHVLTVATIRRPIGEARQQRFRGVLRGGRDSDLAHAVSSRVVPNTAAEAGLRGTRTNVWGLNASTPPPPPPPQPLARAVRPPIARSRKC